MYGPREGARFTQLLTQMIRKEPEGTDSENEVQQH